MKNLSIEKRLTRTVILSLLLTCSINVYAENSEDDLLDDFSLEDLMDIEVTSVSKKAQKLSDTAAAVFVITNEDIKRSGVTSIPEALRIAPGMNVDRIGTNHWAISSRGFTSHFANKLLVMIDGRSVYDPSFSGIYWETQDVLLEDVDRIEVIRGPGGTLWGANAVNGVVNIITKHAADTQGGFVEAGTGTEEKGFVSARYGAELAEDTFGRVYFKAFDRGDSKHANGESANDDWNMLRGGFRIDGQHNDQDSYTLQGDVFSGEINDQAILTSSDTFIRSVQENQAEITGWNILGRWNHLSSSGSEWSLQFHYDQVTNKQVFLRDDHDIFDLDFQYRFFAGQRHDILWGANYRRTQNDFINSSFVKFTDTSPVENQYGLFVKDEITLLEDSLWLTVGTKFQHSDLSNYGLQPSARMLWVPHQKHRIWAAVSRAERSPSHLERFVEITASTIPPFTPGLNPTPFPIVQSIAGSPNFESEDMTAWELGYRAIPSSSLSIDSTIFYNKYKNLQAFTPGAPEFKGTYLNVPIIYSNQDKGKTWGFEVASKWHASDWLQLDLAYSYLRKSLTTPDGSATQNNVSEPKHRISLRSAMQVSEKIDLDLWLRYTSSQTASTILGFDAQHAKNYLTMDLRLAWEPVKNISLELVGQNLLDSQHREHAPVSFFVPAEIERGVYGQVSWKF